jgi:hypothetical protein
MNSRMTLCLHPAAMRKEAVVDLAGKPHAKLLGGGTNLLT